MKQYLSPEQTAKLIELGLPKPRYYCADKYTIIHTGFDIINYSIGELIEMLPEEINKDTLPGTFRVYIDHNKMWAVDYCSMLGEQNSTNSTELIDTLYAMILQLKEERII